MNQFNTSACNSSSAGHQVKLLVSCIGIALAQWAPGLALADSAVGVDMANGNALNPPGRSAVPRPVSRDTMDTIRRSPTGQLYGQPFDQENDGVQKTDGGWEYTGGVEAGAIGGDAGTKNALYRKYKDLKNSPYLNYFEVEANKPDTANYMSAFGGGTGQSDQFYGLQFGRYNDWKIKLFYNETIHVFSDNWKSLFNGEGTGDLSTGLAKPIAVVTALTTGTLGGATLPNGQTYVGPTVSNANNCTAALPCWSYGGKTYQNGVALAAINGMTGTPNSTTGVIANLSGNGATGATQSNIAKAIKDKLDATPETELSLVRKKGGARLDMTFTDYWKGYASYTLEERKGARPFAMNEANFSTEIAEPINYATHELLAGLQYADSLTQANLRAAYSLFHNNVSTLNVQYPMLGAANANGALQTATYDLYPDNSALNIKGEFARSLPDFYNGRFNATAALGVNEQNDALLAPISAAQNAQLYYANWIGTSVGLAGTNPALISNWNTTAALSQQSSKQRIETSLLDLGLAVRPTDALSLKGSFRFFDSANKGGYVAYNPLTGQYGRGFVDGNGLGNQEVVVIPSNTAMFGVGGTANGSNVPVYGQARSTQQTNYVLSGDYDLTRTSSLNAALEREDFKRNFRERENTWEDKLKLGFVNRGLTDATLRASYEVDSKRGSEYRYRTFEDLGTGLPGLTIAEQLAGLSGPNSAKYAAFNANLFSRYAYFFRKYDQADRDQNILNLRLNYQARDDLDLGATLQTKDIKYPNSFYGVDKDKQDSLSLELNFQPSSGKNLYASYTLQQGQKTMNMNSGTGAPTPAPVCTLTSVSSLSPSAIAACSDAARPLTAAWSSDTSDKNDVLGVGFQSEVGGMQFGLDYTYSSSTTDINYNFNRTAAGTALSTVAANQAAMAIVAGSALPSMTFVQQTLSFNLIVPVDKKTSVRLFDRFEMGEVKDWHYDNVIKGAVGAYDSGTLLLDAGAQNYHANVVGVLIQIKL
jgi:hypothetical protein